jgi:hypothetical protein
MTTAPAPLSRAELADLLTGAAHHVSTVPTAEYPTPPGRSYLHPVLGPLSTGPRVVTRLADRLDDFLNEPLPDTPAGLFALASYAAALGWLTEALAELTTAVEQICTTTEAPAGPSAGGDEAVAACGFNALELAAVRAAAQAARLSPDRYVDALSRSLLAAARITDACTEIAAGLADDVAHVLNDASFLQISESGPDSLPALVRTLLARVDTTS